MKTTYNTLVSNIMGVKKRPGAYVGIELEYEGADTDTLLLAPLAAPSWNWTKDHSLRAGGIEFISKPLAPPKIKAALDEIKNIMKTIHVKTSKRCAVHVHVNVSDMNLMQVYQLATYYTLLEPFIFKTYADTREDSHFCVPMWANTNLQRMMYDDAIALHRGISPPPPRPKGMYTTQKMHKCQLKLLGNAKYSAMNFTSLESFGTIEFRQHPGTISMMKVKDWVDFLCNLRAESLKFSSATEIVEEFEKNGFTPLCDNVGIYQSPFTSPEYIEDAVDAAITMVGHAPTNYKNLDWELI